MGCRESFINQATFYPQSGSIIRIADLPESVEHHFLKTSDGIEISSFYLPTLNADKTFLFFHGNAGNASQRLSIAEALRGLNANVLLVDYRGYGLSQGKPSEAGIYIDGCSAMSFLLHDQKLAASDIFVFGRSLGSTVALALAQNHEFAGIVLVSPLSSGRNVAKNTGLGFAAPFLGNPFNNLERVKHVTSPLLIMHGDQDEVLPISMGRALRDAASVPTQFVSFPQAGHNNIIQMYPDKFFEQIKSFCDEIMKPGTVTPTGD